MEIIKHGETSRTEICPICDCLFRYSKKDINYVKNNGIYGPETKEVRCPECNNTIKVE